MNRTAEGSKTPTLRLTRPRSPAVGEPKTASWPVEGSSTNGDRSEVRLERLQLSNRRARGAGLGLALAAAAISGVAVYLNSYGVKAFGNATVYTTLKNFVAAVCLLGLLTLQSLTSAAGHTRLTRPNRAGEWLGLAVVGIVGGSVPFVLFFEGLARASSVHAAFLHKTLVLWVALLAVPLLHERLGRWHWAAIALLVTGQVSIMGGASSKLDAGAAMILGATVLWAVEVIIAKRLLHSLSPTTVGVARMSIGSAALIGWVALRGDAGRLVTLTDRQAGWVVLTGVVLAMYVATWLAALALAPAVDVTAVLVLGAVVTAAIAAVAGNAGVQSQLPGIGLIVLGTALAAWQMVRAAAASRIEAIT